MAETLAELAKRQFGVFSRAQALELGHTGKMIWRRLARGVWVEVERHVYRFEGSDESWHLKLSAALLSMPRALASHRTAAFLWSLEGLGGMPAFPEVTAPFAATRYLRLTKVHHSRRLPTDAALRDGLATTSLARTIIDLSDVVSEDKLFMAFDSGQRKFIGLPGLLEAELKSNAIGRQKRESLLGMLRRARGEQPTDSPLEARAALAMTRHGLPTPRRQLEIHDAAGKFIARVDFAWPDQRVVLQCDSHRWHLAPAQFEKDLRQRRQLESNGWRVVHVTWSMLNSSDWLVDLARLLATQRAFPWGC